MSDNTVHLTFQPSRLVKFAHINRRANASFPRTRESCDTGFLDTKTGFPVCTGMTEGQVELNLRWWVRSLRVE